MKLVNLGKISVETKSKPILVTDPSQRDAAQPVVINGHTCYFAASDEAEFDPLCVE